MGTGLCHGGSFFFLSFLKCVIHWRIYFIQIYEVLQSCPFTLLMDILVNTKEMEINSKNSQRKLMIKNSNSESERPERRAKKEGRFDRRWGERMNSAHLGGQRSLQVEDALVECCHWILDSRHLTRKEKLRKFGSLFKKKIKGSVYKRKIYKICWWGEESELSLQLGKFNKTTFFEISSHSSQTG